MGDVAGVVLNGDLVIALAVLRNEDGVNLISYPVHLVPPFTVCGMTQNW